MYKIRKIKVSTGIYWLEVADANVRILCGCPADAVKHLKKRGLIESLEKQGVRYESGPNAILLSDVLIQNGSFANLTEFPVLQMLYLQGMLIPKHPNNTGQRPILIGTEAQLNAQMEYIFRGNYGLISKEEIIAAGISEEEAERMFQIKLQFAFGSITPPEKLLDKRILEDDPIELAPGVILERLELNHFRLSFEDESIEIDLNLQAGDKYEAAYQLGFHLIPRDYFSIVHSGEGDGWDINRPCMASILIFQGKIFLIDAGPNILTSLNCLGISVNEIEGIFHTHAHDDHFAGLTTLIRTDRRFKYFATPLVRMAVTKKLCALMSIKEQRFSEFFDIHDLTFDEWTSVEGLEVMPAYSPHPVETNIFFFRTRWDDTYKSYAHLGDVASFAVLDRMKGKNGITEEHMEAVKKMYVRNSDLKKIDIGGGMIHGDAEDFTQDTSLKLVLAHTSQPLTLRQREIGSSAAFGMTDILIPGRQNYLQEAARRHLMFYFPDAAEHDLHYLLNHPFEAFNAGTILMKKDYPPEYVYLLLTGTVEYQDQRTGQLQAFSAGSLIGFYSGYNSEVVGETYWAASHISVVSIPLDTYKDFLSRNKLWKEIQEMQERIWFLRETYLFGEVVTFPILARVARLLTTLRPTEGIHPCNPELLYLIKKGEVALLYGNHLLDNHSAYDFVGGHSLLLDAHEKTQIRIEGEVECFVLDANALREIPVVYWKLFEVQERLLRTIRDI